jgi:hypothetical protein
LFGGLVGFEGDGVAESFELALQASSAMLRRVALALPIRSEVSERDLIADDVVVGDKQVVADRADGFGLAAATAQLGEVRREVGVFGADRRAGAFGELGGEPAWPWAGASGAPSTG